MMTEMRFKSFDYHEAVPAQNNENLIDPVGPLSFEYGKYGCFVEMDRRCIVILLHDVVLRCYIRHSNSRKSSNPKLSFFDQRCNARSTSSTWVLERIVCGRIRISLMILRQRQLGPEILEKHSKSDENEIKCNIGFCLLDSSTMIRQQNPGTVCFMPWLRRIDTEARWEEQIEEFTPVQMENRNRNQMDSTKDIGFYSSISETVVERDRNKKNICDMSIGFACRLFRSRFRDSVSKAITIVKK